MQRQTMLRRQLLATTGVAGVGGLAGCFGGGNDEASDPETDSQAEETEPEPMGGTDTPGETREKTVTITEAQSVTLTF